MRLVGDATLKHEIGRTWQATFGYGRDVYLHQAWGDVPTEALAGSKDWGPTSTAFRTLMQRWKAAGPATREAEEELWTRFKAAQDTFFTARSAVFDERDAEQQPETSHWGRRQLAYPIGSRENGYYVVSRFTADPTVLAVRAEAPWKTVKDFVALAKQKPGELNYASAGTGTTTHLTGALFLARAGVKMTHIPYKGGPEGVTSVLTGETDFYFIPLPAAPSRAAFAITAARAARRPRSATSAAGSSTPGRLRTWPRSPSKRPAHSLGACDAVVAAQDAVQDQA